MTKIKRSWVKDSLPSFPSPPPLPLLPSLLRQEPITVSRPVSLGDRCLTVCEEVDSDSRVLTVNVALNPSETLQKPFRKSQPVSSPFWVIAGDVTKRRRFLLSPASRLRGFPAVTKRTGPNRGVRSEETPRKPQGVARLIRKTENNMGRGLNSKAGCPLRHVLLWGFSEEAVSRGWGVLSARKHPLEKRKNVINFGVKYKNSMRLVFA